MIHIHEWYWIKPAKISSLKIISWSPIISRCQKSTVFSFIKINNCISNKADRYALISYGDLWAPSLFYFSVFWKVKKAPNMATSSEQSFQSWEKNWGSVKTFDDVKTFYQKTWIFYILLKKQWRNGLIFSPKFSTQQLKQLFLSTIGIQRFFFRRNSSIWWRHLSAKITR